MKNHLADLDDLVVGCRSKEARLYAAESVVAYRAGAIRSSVVAIWNAVVYDVVDKIRSLAADGSDAAKSLSNEIDASIDAFQTGDSSAAQKWLAFERRCIEKSASQLHLFDSLQQRELEFIQAERNRCAHPTFDSDLRPYEPSAEQARAFIVAAFKHCLHRPPIQSRFAIERVFQACTSDYFATDAKLAAELLRAGPLGYPTPNLVSGSIDRLFLEFADPEKEHHLDERIEAALLALVQMHREEAEPRLAKRISKALQTLDDAVGKAVLRLLAGCPEVCTQTDPIAHEALEPFICSMSESEFASIYSEIKSISGLSEIRQARVKSLERSGLVSILRNGFAEDVIEPAVTAYCSAPNWPVANALSTDLVTPLLEYLTDDQVEQILSSAESGDSDLIGSWGFAEFLERAWQEPALDKAKLATLLDKQVLLRLLPETMSAEITAATGSADG